MRLFLIRHGETVDNVAGLYAGITDSALTNHGVLQAARLGQHLAHTAVKISHIFSSDLTRAFKTAESIRLAQPIPGDEEAPFAHETKQLALLRERDFGSLEGKSFSDRSGAVKVHKNDSAFKDVEAEEAIKARSDTFIDEHLLDLFYTVPGDHAVVVVAHGVILAHLWRCIFHRLPPKAVSLAPSVIATGRSLDLEHLSGWSNTGYLELEIKSKMGERPAETSSPAAAKTPELASVVEANTPTTVIPGRRLLVISMVVKAINSLEHLKGFKKTRGGIGSSKHDESQKTMESFFKKRKIG